MQKPGGWAACRDPRAIVFGAILPTLATDIFYLINYLFAEGPPPTTGGDANGDQTFSVADVICLVNTLFAGGPPPSSATFTGEFFLEVPAGEAKR